MSNYTMALNKKIEIYGHDFDIKILISKEGAMHSVYKFYFRSKGELLFDTELKLNQYKYDNHAEALEDAVNLFKEAYYSKEVAKFYDVEYDYFDKKEAINKELELLNVKLKKIGENKEKYEHHTEAYRNLIQDEIDLLVQKSALLEKLK